MVSTLLRYAAIGGVIAFLTTSCGTEGNGGTEPTGTATISLSLNPTTASVEQGGTISFTGTVTSKGGFSGSVTVTLEGAPAGVVGTVSNVQTSGGTTTATVTIQTDQSAAAAAYTLTVRAAGTGVSDATADFALTVVNAPFTISVSSGPLSIEQGTNNTAQIDLARAGFTEPVTLALENAPAGVTSDFDPNPVTGNTSNLTVTVGNSVPAGTYPLTIRGTATGHADQIITADLTVLTFSGASLVVDWSGCPLAERPVWVAQQDGSGPWTPITGTNDVYTFNFNLSAGGVAVVLDDGASAEVNVDYALVSELPTETVIECDDPILKTNSVTVAGLGAETVPASILGRPRRYVGERSAPDSKHSAGES